MLRFAGKAVTLDAGAASEYLWSTGETTSSIDVDATGSYSVTITDVNGCTDISNAVDVTVNPIPVATITPDGPTEFCEDGSVLLTASAGDSLSGAPVIIYLCISRWFL